MFSWGEGRGVEHFVSMQLTLFLEFKDVQHSLFYLSSKGKGLLLDKNPFP